MFKRAPITDEIIVMRQGFNLHPIATMKDEHKNTVQICKDEKGYEVFIKVHATEAYGHVTVLPKEIVEELHSLVEKETRGK